MHQKHLLIVTSEFPPQPGGIGNHAYNLATQLSLKGYVVSVLTDQRSANGAEEKNFDAAHDLHVHRIKLRRFRGFMYVQRFLKLFSLVTSVDVVIASGKFSMWIVALGSLLSKRKYIAVIHGSEVNFKNKLLKKSIEHALTRFDVIIAVSNFTKSLIHHLNLPVTVIPNGYDKHKWRKGITPETAHNGHPCLVSVGNVTARKGQLNVILQMPNLKLKYPEIHYHCIGLPTEANAFKQKAQELSVEDCVTFHGRLEDFKMQSLLMASDIFVMLSEETHTGDVEGFGIAVIEANALGLPAIGAAGSGLDDAIVDGVTGYLIASSDGVAFQNAIDTLLSAPDVFGNSAKKWAEEHQWNRIITHYLAVIDP